MWADIIAEKGFLQYSELPGMESPQQGRADVGRYHSRGRVSCSTVNDQVCQVLIKDAQIWADIIAGKGFLQYSELLGMESPQQGRADVGRYHSREGFPAVQ